MPTPLVHLVLIRLDSALSNKKSFFVLLAAWFVAAKSYRNAQPSFPRWRRMGNIIASVDKYSKILTRETIEEDRRFLNFTNFLATRSEPPYLLYLDKGFLEITLNHICNLKYMPGSIERLAVVSFDPETEKQFNVVYPSIPTTSLDFSVVRMSSPSDKSAFLTREIDENARLLLYKKFPLVQSPAMGKVLTAQERRTYPYYRIPRQKAGLSDAVPKDLENHRYVIYQLVLMMRSHIASVMSRRNISFWSMQQDSLWTENFVRMNVEQHYPNALLIFDTVGNAQVPIYERLMKGWICGSTFFVRASPVTAGFFEKVALLMTRRQSPDSAIMTYLCGAPQYHCAKMPRWVVSSSNFFMGDRSLIPVIIQVDHESKMSKMELFRKENFFFMKDDGSCNASAVVHLKEAVTVALDEVRVELKEEEIPVLEYVLWNLHRWLGLDPYYNKNFLRVHEGII